MGSEQYSVAVTSSPSGEPGNRASQVNCGAASVTHTNWLAIRMLNLLLGD
jgi:hypothetical protein